MYYGAVFSSANMRLSDSNATPRLQRQPNEQTLSKLVKKLQHFHGIFILLPKPENEVFIHFETNLKENMLSI